MYHIIHRILGPGILFTWTVICATYIRFHHSIKLERQGAAIHVKARSPLRPSLAIYSLAISALLTTRLHPSFPFPFFLNHSFFYSLAEPTPTTLFLGLPCL